MLEEVNLICPLGGRRKIQCVIATMAGNGYEFNSMVAHLQYCSGVGVNARFYAADHG
jgi:hypothetical protein